MSLDDIYFWLRWVEGLSTLLLNTLIKYYLRFINLPDYYSNYIFSHHNRYKEIVTDQVLQIN